MSLSSAEVAGTPTEGGAALVLPPNPQGQSIAHIVHNDDGSITIRYTEKIEHTEDQHEWSHFGSGVLDGQHHLVYRCACGADKVEEVSPEQYANPPHKHAFVCSVCGVTGSQA